MLGMQRTEARWRIYAWALETIRWSPGMQRVYAKTCWRVGAVAMHGLQRLERRKRVRGDARPAAMYVLPCEATKWCDGCSARKTEDKFSRAMWQRKRAGERYCTCCAKKSHGLWTCGGCGTKKRRTEFQICQVHTDQPRVQNGKQLCADCRRPSPGHAIAAKAAAWLAPRRAKLAKKEVAERKERILADVWAEIRKKRAMATVEAMEDPSAKRQKSDGSAPAVPLQTVEATQNGDANETKMEPGSKRKCEARVAEAATHPSVATQVKKRMLPRKQENAVPGKFLYDCPFCHVGVTSSARTGQVNHRKVCGRFFSVRDGKLDRKAGWPLVRVQRSKGWMGGWVEPN